MYIRLKVIAGTKKETFKELSENTYQISVKEPAERNMANRRVLALVKEKLGAKSVRLVSGHHSGTKIADVLI